MDTQRIRSMSNAAVISSWLFRCANIRQWINEWIRSSFATKCKIVEILGIISNKSRCRVVAINLISILMEWISSICDLFINREPFEWRNESINRSGDSWRFRLWDAETIIASFKCATIRSLSNANAFYVDQTTTNSTKLCPTDAINFSAKI